MSYDDFVSQITEQIKEKIDIVEFLKERIQLLPAGRNFRALCPFHKESNPSFMITPERQSWYCFGGCNEGGDIFKFLMKYENLEFHEALKVLAEKTGVELRGNFGGAGDYQQYGVLYEINQSAKNFFQSKLSHSKPALDYLIGRGIKKETIADFELGLAPVGFDELMLDLVGLGFNVNDIERAGLIIKNRRGTYQDRFRQRLMFPLFSNFGKVIGFTGRILDLSPQTAPPLGSSSYTPAKYINSSESPVFNKSRLLYGFHKTKSDIREKKEAVLVEGQMDLLMAYQDGVRNTIGVSGTALTEHHLKTLRRLADELILCFDGDEAGQLAAERSIDLASMLDFSTRVLLLREYDPADIVQKTPGQFQQLVNQSGLAQDFLFKRYFKEGQSSSERKEVVRIILKKIKNLASSIDRSEWLKKLSAKTSISENVLIEEMNELKSVAYAPPPINHPLSDSQPSFSKKQLLAQRIADLGGVAPSELLQNLSNELIMKASLDNSFVSSEKKEQELSSLNRELESILLKEKQQQLRQRIVQLEELGDETALHIALKEFDELNKKFYNI